MLSVTQRTSEREEISHEALAAPLRLAYLILAHKNPGQLIRLIDRLDKRDGPGCTFVVHLDWKSSGTDWAEATCGLQRPNVHWAQRVDCRWGDFTLVQATLNCIRALEETGERFDFVTLLSGQDYPIKSNSQIEVFLKRRLGKCLMYFYPFPYPEWAWGGYSRLPTWRVNVSGRARRLVPVHFSRLAHDRIPGRFHPCGGSQWWTPPGDAVAFAHGFNIHFGQIKPPPGVDVWMIAPKGPGHLVRRTFEEGGGVPSLVAVAADETGKGKQTALAYAKAIGATRAGVLDTTFEEETETDLFGEQVVLCGGLTQLIMSSYETLVAAGYQPESAYFECLHELKLIVDLMYEEGISGMRYSISDTAEYGDVSRGPRIINADTKAEMRKILDEIRSGAFATEWINESRSGRANFHRLVKEGEQHQIEQVGKELRGMMPWISAGKQSVSEVSGGGDV